MAEAAEIQTKVWSKEEMVSLATQDAQARGLNVNHFLAVINRESGWDPNIQSSYPNAIGPNSREDSWGLVQINLPSNTSTTREMALDPLCALSFMADSWQAGQAPHWTAYRQLEAEYGVGQWPED